MNSSLSRWIFIDWRVLFQKNAIVLAWSKWVAKGTASAAPFSYYDCLKKQPKSITTWASNSPTCCCGMGIKAIESSGPRKIFKTGWSINWLNLSLHHSVLAPALSGGRWTWRQPDFCILTPPSRWRYVEAFAYEASTQTIKKEVGPSAHPKQTHWRHHAFHLILSNWGPLPSIKCT